MHTRNTNIHQKKKSNCTHRETVKAGAVIKLLWTSHKSRLKVTCPTQLPSSSFCASETKWNHAIQLFGGWNKCRVVRRWAQCQGAPITRQPLLFIGPSPKRTLWGQSGLSPFPWRNMRRTIQTLQCLEKSPNYRCNSWCVTRHFFSSPLQRLYKCLQILSLARREDGLLESPLDIMHSLHTFSPILRSDRLTHEVPSKLYYFMTIGATGRMHICYFLVKLASAPPNIYTVHEGIEECIISLAPRIEKFRLCGRKMRKKNWVQWVCTRPSD